MNEIERDERAPMGQCYLVECEPYFNVGILTERIEIDAQGVVEENGILC